MSVYLAEAGTTGLHKVGFSADPSRRFRELNGVSPYPLRLLALIDRGDRTDETILHRRLKPWRDHGEWYRLNPLLREVCHATGRVTLPWDDLLRFVAGWGSIDVPSRRSYVLWECLTWKVPA